MCASKKSISMLLYDGSLEGIARLESSSWNAGQLFSAPRNRISELQKLGVCSKFGVYLLLSQEKVYAGQSSDLAKRINQHTLGKDWWTRVIVLTTKDDSLNHSDIDYLESVFIERAQKSNKLVCDNKNSGNPPKVDDYRKVYLDQYLAEALQLLELIGASVLSEKIDRSSAETNSKVTFDFDGQCATPGAVGAEVIIPPLPDQSMKIGQLVYLSMHQLSEAGYSFSSEQIDMMCTSKWSKDHFHTVQPFMKRFIPGQTDTKGADGRSRFKKEPYLFGDQQVLISTEWYERQRPLFIDWYYSL